MAEQYDLAVIGAGSGGYVAAIRAAQLGMKTVCIDKRIDPGGTCLNVGCIPSKALLQSTELLAHLQHGGAEHGITCSNLTIDFAKMMQRKSQIVKGLVDIVKGLFKGYKVTFINGTARLEDAHHIEVVGEGGNIEKIEAKNILLATGSEPISLPILPFDERQIVSSTGALALKRIPKNLVIVGGGIIGVEIGSVYQRLGSNVTIIEMLDHICTGMDQSVCQSLLQILKKQGLKFLLSSQVITAVVQPDEVILTIAQGESLSNLSADVVLVAVGRRPYSQNLDLDKVGIKVSPKGFVQVNDAFQTSLPHIYAIGDLIEGPMLAHRAFAEGTAVVDMLAGRSPSINYMAIPNVIYTSPEAAGVGMTESEARAAGIKIKVGTSLFKGNPRARCSGETEGFVKVICEVQSSRILGMHIVNTHASELIADGMIAIEKGITVKEMGNYAYSHPTLSEDIKEACLLALG